MGSLFQGTNRQEGGDSWHQEDVGRLSYSGSREEYIWHPSDFFRCLLVLLCPVLTVIGKFRNLSQRRTWWLGPQTPLVRFMPPGKTHRPVEMLGEVEENIEWRWRRRQCVSLVIPRLAAQLGLCFLPLNLSKFTWGRIHHKAASRMYSEQ